jgi:hypothetical protein
MIFASFSINRNCEQAWATEVSAYPVTSVYGEAHILALLSGEDKRN